MIEAIQHAYYLESRNPSDDATLTALAQDIGLDTTRFTELLNADDTQQTLNAEMQQARTLGVSGFPSLRLHVNDTVWSIAIDYNNPAAMLENILLLIDHGTDSPKKPGLGPVDL